MRKSCFCNFLKLHILHAILHENYQNFEKHLHDLYERTQYAEQILFEEKISIFNFVVGERRRKNSNFHNFRKFRAVRENRTYAMLKSVFYSIHTRNLKKKFGAVFEKILKIPGGFI